MEIGKLPNSLLEKLVISSIETIRTETILSPNIGEDCCALNLSEDLCVVSSDPITAADENAGILSVLISLNDIAASGAEPVGILSTVLFPPGISENYIEKLFKNINETCRKCNIDILGGHTEVTDSVKKTVIVTTAIGRTSQNKLIRSDGAFPGDSILMTKSAGLEGTAIICADKNTEILDILSSDEINEGLAYLNEISVIKESEIAVQTGGIHAMHDITEGGVLGAVWEISKASNTGAIIYKEKIKVRPITKVLCNHFKLDPLKLISSGSMLIVCDPLKRKEIIGNLLDYNIFCSYIGDINKNKNIKLKSGNDITVVDEPEADELYKVI